MGTNDDTDVQTEQHEPDGEPQEKLEIKDTEIKETYLQRVDANIRLSRERTASMLAKILVIAVVASLPLYVLAAYFVGGLGKDDLSQIFERWYDIVSPLVGTAIGALFGIEIASHNRD